MEKKNLSCETNHYPSHHCEKKNFLPAGSSRAALDAPTQEQLTVVNMQRNESYPHFLLEVKTKKMYLDKKKKKLILVKQPVSMSFPRELNFLSLNKNVSWCLLLLLLAFLPSFALLRTRISSTTLLGPSLEFWDHLSHIKHHILTCIKKQQQKNSDVSSQ